MVSHVLIIDFLVREKEMVHGKGLEYVRIDGSTMASDRQKAVDAFQAKDEVFLLVAVIISLS